MRNYFMNSDIIILVANLNFTLREFKIRGPKAMMGSFSNYFIYKFEGKCLLDIGHVKPKSI